MTRLKSAIWVQGYLRRLNALAVPAMVLHHGHDEAGAIYIKIASLDGHSALYGPAPAGLDAAARERLWVRLHNGLTLPETEADRQLGRAREFDPDAWVIEVEDRERRHFLEDWLAQE